MLTVACIVKDWEKAKDIITKRPHEIYTSKIKYGYTPAYWASFYNNVTMLNHMLRTIESFNVTDEQREQILRDTFERGSDDGYTPAHAAARAGNIESLEFLVQNCPSGNMVLKTKTKKGITPAHSATYYGKQDALDFIMRATP